MPGSPCPSKIGRIKCAVHSFKIFPLGGYLPCRSGPPVDGPKDPWPHVLSLPGRFVASLASDNISKVAWTQTLYAEGPCCKVIKGSDGNDFFRSPHHPWPLSRLRGAKKVFYGAKEVHFKYTKNRMGSALEVQHPKYTSYKWSLIEVSGSPNQVLRRCPF